MLATDQTLTAVVRSNQFPGKGRSTEVQTPMCGGEVQCPGKRRSAEAQIPVCSDEIQSMGGSRLSVEVQNHLGSDEA